MGHFYKKCFFTTIKDFYFFSLHSIRMNTKKINFDDKKIKKSDFYKNKRAFHIDKIDVNKILVFKKKRTIWHKECA